MRLRAAGSFLSFLIYVVLVGALPAASQTLEKGSITGTVYDPIGAVVPGATIKLTRVATGSRARGYRGRENGRYAFSVLPPGDYRMEVSASGFATAIFQDVNLSVGQELVKDVSLILAAMGERFAVAAEAGPIDTSESRPQCGHRRDLCGRVAHQWP